MCVGMGGGGGLGLTSVSRDTLDTIEMSVEAVAKHLKTELPSNPLQHLDLVKSNKFNAKTSRTSEHEHERC